MRIVILDTKDHFVVSDANDMIGLLTRHAYKPSVERMISDYLTDNLIPIDTINATINTYQEYHKFAIDIDAPTIGFIDWYVENGYGISTGFTKHEFPAAKSVARTPAGQLLIDGIYDFHYDLNIRTSISYGHMTLDDFIMQFTLYTQSKNMMSIIYYTAMKEWLRWYSMRMHFAENKVSRLKHEIARATLPVGNLTDMALANAVFMDETPELCKAAVARLKWLASFDDYGIIEYDYVKGVTL